MTFENPLFNPEVADDTPVTIAQVKEYLHVSSSRMYSLVREGKLPYIKGIGRELLFKAKDIKALMESHQVDPTTPELPNKHNQPSPA